ncbi:zinc finger protein 628-like [Sycon ciliatum]|uniref:zinc finger protein 628-like n=1 Tax=Sycon ciliatum TaxID=27933 RepID=UPI0031F67556
MAAVLGASSIRGEPGQQEACAMEDPRLPSALPSIQDLKGERAHETPSGEPTFVKETEESRSCPAPQADPPPTRTAEQNVVVQKISGDVACQYSSVVDCPSQDLGQSVDYYNSPGHSSTDGSTDKNKLNEGNSSDGGDNAGRVARASENVQNARCPVAVAATSSACSAPVNLSGPIVSGAAAVSQVNSVQTIACPDGTAVTYSGIASSLVPPGLVIPQLFSSFSASAAVATTSQIAAGVQYTCMPVSTSTVSAHPLFTDKMLHPSSVSLESSPGMGSDDDDDEDSSSGDDADNEMSETEEMDTSSLSDLNALSASQAEADGMSGISQLIQAAQADLTPGIEMLAAAAQNATPAGFPCPHCNKTYPMASGLRRHVKRSHSSTSNSSNGNPFASSSQQSEKRPGKCSFCQADLPYPATQAVRRRHMRGECTMNPYSCPSCSKVFVSPGGLQRHSLMHNGKRPFQCTICSKEFTQASHLKVHMNGHTGEKPYQCDFEDCGKTYSDPSSLRSHKLAHAGIKAKKKRNPDAPYLANPKCAYCDQRFASRAARDQHARECARNPYRCMICQKACLGMVKLERHIRSHSRSRVSSLKAQEMAKNKKTQSPDPKCAYCTERFPTRVVRDRHSRMCSNNPYRCKLCYKAFLGSAKLLRHARSHAEGTSTPSAAATAAIAHATALAEANPEEATRCDKAEQTADPPCVSDTTMTGIDAQVSSSSCAATPSLVGSVSSTPLASSPLSVLAPASSANLNSLLMTPSNHNMIAIPTPIGYSLVPNPFSSLGNTPLMTPSAQEEALSAQSGVFNQQSGQTAVQSVVSTASVLGGQDLASTNSTLSAAAAEACEAASTASSADSVTPTIVVREDCLTGSPPDAALLACAGTQQQQQGESGSTPAGTQPETSIDLSDKPTSSLMSRETEPVAMDTTQQETNTEPSDNPMCASVASASTAVTSTTVAVAAAHAASDSNPPVQNQQSFLSSLQAPFPYPFEMPTVPGVSLTGGTGTAALDPVPSLLQSILAGTDSMAGTSQVPLQQQASVAQQVQELLQSSAQGTVELQQQLQSIFPLSSAEAEKLLAPQKPANESAAAEVPVDATISKAELNDASPLAAELAGADSAVPSS